MEREYWSRNEKIVFNGDNYFEDPRTGYFYRSIPKTTKKLLLHREVWKDKNGEIPKGFVIHHIDHDKRYNALANLACMDRKAHQSYHANDCEYLGSEANIKQLAAARQKANAWHGSPEGLAWHSENGKKAWDNRVGHTKKCDFCTKEYETPFPERSKFCDTKCKEKARHIRRYKVKKS